MLKSLQVMRADFDLPLYSLALIDVVMEALHDPGGDQAQEEANSRTLQSRFSAPCIPSVTIQRSVLTPMRMDLCGENATILNSTIMLAGGIFDTGESRFSSDYLSISRSHLGATEKVGFRVETEDVLAVATSTLANVTLKVTGNASIVESNMTGKYHLRLDGNYNHVENSHFGACLRKLRGDAFPANCSRRLLHADRSVRLGQYRCALGDSRHGNLRCLHPVPRVLWQG